MAKLRRRALDKPEGSTAAPGFLHAGTSGTVRLTKAKS